MADFLAVLGVIVFVGAMLGLIRAVVAAGPLHAARARTATAAIAK